ncbi:hypothetical protein DL237_08165 [Pseudooceanicola sediminis]|uniref:Uncharacterized protein n=1 Tax=Pseudooceanicola sediminis TaxID=2211117 RepID=A0A399J1H5_9RHOB|nr:hypothetical protein [Pseudooceanicola sediminis]KAA2316213.1 hypothetical protein E0K93_05020 [Puniceibacterium sp. HSS470]RII39124.1 hypothetical protein DL237_08165 [Pseudooceanicola sediminis]|tara:strand:+ start:47188 stop:47382 length:195 start_codon:yes stop_codon:yes gene_type:complete
MSAPQTDVEKQARSHRSVIWGIVIVVVFGLAMAGFITLSGTSGEDDPDDAATTPTTSAGQTESN